MEAPSPSFERKQILNIPNEIVDTVNHHFTVVFKRKRRLTVFFQTYFKQYNNFAQSPFSETYVVENRYFTVFFIGEKLRRVKPGRQKKIQLVRLC